MEMSRPCLLCLLLPAWVMAHSGGPLPVPPSLCPHSVASQHLARVTLGCVISSLPCPGARRSCGQGSAHTPLRPQSLSSTGVAVTPDANLLDKEGEAVEGGQLVRSSAAVTKCRPARSKHRNLCLHRLEAASPRQDPAGGALVTLLLRCQTPVLLSWRAGSSSPWRRGSPQSPSGGPFVLKGPSPKIIAWALQREFGGGAHI